VIPTAPADLRADPDRFEGPHPGRSEVVLCTLRPLICGQTRIDSKGTIRAETESALSTGIAVMHRPANPRTVSITT
jgi:hypothetical protein